MNNEFRNTDYHTVVIDGSKLSSGIYFYQFTSEKINVVKKMIFIK